MEQSTSAKLVELLQRVEALLNRISAERDDVPLNQKWYSLDEACALKGTCPKTARNQPWLQPNGGQPDGVVGRKRRWRRETVREWLEQTDEELLS